MQKQGPDDKPGWRVLLIGGNPGAGKTAIARTLARQMGVSLLQVDDILMALQEGTQPGEQPDLHFFEITPHVWQKSPETLCQSLVALANALVRPLAANIAHHVFGRGSGPLIIEGSGILPALAAQKTFPTLHFSATPVTHEVRSVFLVELDELTLTRHLAAPTNRNNTEFGAREQQNLVQASWLYGQWLKRQADHYDLPLIDPRPHENVIERILQAIRV
jgi:2-phosphoglycerate kinase